MNEKGESILDNFLIKIEELYRDIDSWISSYGLTSIKEKVEIREETLGAYNADKLGILDKRKKFVAEIRPIGASVIGAEGRLDLTGKFDKAILVYLEKERPELISTIKDGEREYAHTEKLFKGAKEAGWYWIEDKLRGKAHMVNKELFFDLLSVVSDYER